MSLEKLYIPTYRRSRQYTFENLPEKWKKKTVLVVDEQDAEMHGKKGYPTLLCPVQGTGISYVREWIAKQAIKDKVTKYGVLDDDLYNFAYTRLATEKDKFPLWNTKFKDPDYDAAFDLMSEWLDDFVTCGLEICWNPPLEKMFHQNFRQNGAHFYNAKTFPHDKLSWHDVPHAEDFNITLQLLSMGYQNRISLRYRVRPMPTQQSVGGMTLSRTIDTHNESMRALQAKFPQFVKLYDKITKEGIGKWGGQTKVAAEIAWKKCWNASQAVPERTLEEFFT